MTIDMRHELGKQERVALAVLGFGSLFSLGVGFAILLYQSQTIGFIVIFSSGLILLSVLITNSLHYISPRTYNRLVLLLNPNAVLREVHPTLPADDCPPSYKKSWAKAFKQRTTTSSSTTTGVEASLPPPVEVDIEQHLGGRVVRDERGKGRSEGRKLRGKRSQELCVQEARKSDQELPEDERNSPPPFEVAILKLSAKELEGINKTLPESSKYINTHDSVVMEVGLPRVLGKPSDVFTVEQEIRRGNTETTEITFLPRRTELEVAHVHSPQLSSERPSVSQTGSIPQDDQSNLRVIVSNGRLTVKTAKKSGSRVQT